LKPGKSPNELTSYWPISPLPIVSKVFEKLLLNRLLTMVERWYHSHSGFSNGKEMDNKKH
jgi:hypothetical protein